MSAEEIGGRSNGRYCPDQPRFEISFWGLEKALPFMLKRAAMPVAALPLLAALTRRSTASR